MLYLRYLLGMKKIFELEVDECMFSCVTTAIFACAVSFKKDAFYCLVGFETATFVHVLFVVGKMIQC